MSKQKIVIIGAGSHFTPGLLGDFTNAEELAGSTVVLHDIEAPGLEIMAKLGRRMAKEKNVDLHIESTLDRREALSDADFVISTIRVGGLNAHRKDIEIPLKYDIYQGVGDTVGPGGLLVALRHIPVTIEFCRDMEELCPDAWLFNFTNPMTAICRAARKVTNIKIVGLCHGIFGTRRFLADYLGVQINDFHVQAAGINHFTWIYDMRHNGEYAYPLLRQKYAEVGPKTQPVSFQLCEIYGLYPSPGDRHVAEFLPFYHRKEADGGAKYGLHLRNVDAMEKGKDEYWARLSGQTDGTQPLSGYGSGEEVKGIITALLENKNSIHVVNVPNRGAIPHLPDTAVVEVTAMIGADGMKSICVDELPQGITTILRTRILQQELTVDAALTGDKKLALQALLADSMTHSVEDARKLIDELIEAHAEHLPQFS